MRHLIIAYLLFISATALASNVSIVDSGTYFDHDLLKGHAWLNSKEVSGNRVDDDRNGKVDDIVGWNFAENFSKVFYPEHIERIHPITYQIFEILAKTQLGTLTQEDKEFWDKNVASLPKEKKEQLLAHLNYYGQYAHSTHCSGIVAMGNENARIMSARVFPDSQPDPYDQAYSLASMVLAPSGASDLYYKALASVANQSFIKVAEYLHENGMEVANYSLGTSMPQIARQYLALIGNKNPTSEQVAKESQKAFKAFGPIGQRWMRSSAETLFVIAAGNDSMDNDQFPFFPANVNSENSITVAATLGYRKLAEFSNHGLKSVHIAAPGVAIMSSVPGPQSGMQLPMSGTSMAAPYVTMVASRMKDLNRRLSPQEIKEILMATVDSKDWLKDKVISAGVINPERAYLAATYSDTLSLSDAITRARNEIPDVVEVPSILSDKQENSQAPSLELKSWAKSAVF